MPYMQLDSRVPYTCHATHTCTHANACMRCMTLPSWVCMYVCMMLFMWLSSAVGSRPSTIQMKTRNALADSREEKRGIHSAAALPDMAYWPQCRQPTSEQASSPSTHFSVSRMGPKCDLAAEPLLGDWLVHRMQGTHRLP